MKWDGLMVEDEDRVMGLWGGSNMHACALDTDLDRLEVAVLPRRLGETQSEQQDQVHWGLSRPNAEPWQGPPRPAFSIQHSGRVFGQPEQ